MYVEGRWPDSGWGQRQDLAWEGKVEGGETAEGLNSRPPRCPGEWWAVSSQSWIICWCLDGWSLFFQGGGQFLAPLQQRLFLCCYVIIEENYHRGLSDIFSGCALFLTGMAFVISNFLVLSFLEGERSCDLTGFTWTFIFHTQPWNR